MSEQQPDSPLSKSPTREGERASEPGSERTRPADTILGRILVGVVGALATGVIGYVIGLLTAAPSLPQANLVPREVSTTFDQPVSISAVGSTDPKGRELTFEWTVNDRLVAKNTVATCFPGQDIAIIACRFPLPGIHVVSVTVTNPDGYQSKASSSITVAMPRGYLGLIFAPTGSQTEDEAIARALLHSIDWLKVQSRTRTHILLYDPDQGSVVFAASVNRDPERAEPSVLAGSQILLPDASQEFLTVITEELERLGVDPQIWSPETIENAVEQGAGNIGLAPFSSPADFSARTQ